MDPFRLYNLEYIAHLLILLSRSLLLAGVVSSVSLEEMALCVSGIRWKAAAVGWKPYGI